jgi:hypothetical protein
MLLNQVETAIIIYKVISKTEHKSCPVIFSDINVKNTCIIISLYVRMLCYISVTCFLLRLKIRVSASAKIPSSRSERNRNKYF